MRFVTSLPVLALLLQDPRRFDSIFVTCTMQIGGTIILRDDDSHSEEGIADGMDTKLVDLPVTMLEIICEFVIDCIDITLVSKRIKTAFEGAAENTITKMSGSFFVGNTKLWKRCVRERATKRINEYYDKHGIEPPQSVERTNTARLRLRCTTEVPLSTLEMDTLPLGPLDILPDGNIVFYCQDGFFRFYNVSQGTFYQQVEATGSSISLDREMLRDLHCSNDHLLLKHMGMGADPCSYSVWNLQDFTFVRDIQAGPFKTSLVDTQNSKIIAGTFEAPVFNVVSIDIESGRRIVFPPISMQDLAATHSIFYIEGVGLSGRKIIVAVTTLDGGGLYILDQDHPTRAYQYFPCFEECAYACVTALNTRCGQWPFLTFSYADDNSVTRPLRAIRFVEGKYAAVRPEVDNDFVSVGNAFLNHVVRVSHTRLFAHNPGEMTIDEIDVESGRKVRTIYLGYPGRNHQLTYMDSTDSVLFCVISRLGSPVSILETFLL